MWKSKLSLECGLVVALFPFTGIACGQTIHCVSDDGGKKYCQTDTTNGVRLVKERSTEIPCRKDSSWGYDTKGIWVDHGCDADFALGPEVAAGGGGKLLTCTSDGAKKYCDANTGGGVRLAKQRGDAPCKKDSSWGYDGIGIWVDQGCSADFVLGGTAQQDSSGGEPPGAKDRTCLKAVGKARSDQMVKQCLQVSPATHPPCNAQNSCDLMNDEIRRSCALLGRDAPAFCGGYK